MADYQRYQTLSSAEQYLFSPSCPVWVQKYQLSWDVQTGNRLLQCRMVNVSEKAVTAVYLRVLCRDEQGQGLTMLHVVPVTGLFVTPGELFGDDKVVTLWPKRTAFAEVFAERVCFSDGTAWNEQLPPDYEAIPAPAQVRPEDALYPKLALAAREGGARNDFYFRATKRIWICTCGLPNSSTVLRCRHCGADRTWLERHMDVLTLSAPPAPEPPVPATEPEPPAPAVTQEPQIQAPLEKFDLASYLTAEPMHSPVPAQEEFPVIQSRPEPAPEPPAPAEKPKKRRGGRIAAIVLAILLFLGVGAWIAWRQFLAPYLRYQEAVSAQENGDYEKALEIFRTLGGYEDSEARIAECEFRLALESFRTGDYAAAYEQLKDMPGKETYAADCLYSQGVLAYNAQNYDDAWKYVKLLEEQYPTYENTKQLRDPCCYAFGERAVQSAGSADSLQESHTFYDEAKSWFTEAGNYSNSAAMITECDYQMAKLTLEEAYAYNDGSMFLLAVERFEALGSYSASAEKRQEAMFGYCGCEADPENETTLAFLKELTEAGYQGAGELYDQIFPMTVEIELWTREDDNSQTPVGETLTLAQMDRLMLRYSVEGGRDEGVIRILLVYTLPGSAPGSITINPDGSRDDALPLYDVLPVKASKEGTVKLQFYNAKTGAEIKTVTFEIPTETTTT